MGGLFTKPQSIGATTCEDVIESFRWLESQFPAYKHLSQTSSARARAQLQQKILDRADEEFKQAEIVAMDVTHTLLGAQMWGFTDPRRLSIHRIIVEALKYSKKGSKVLVTYAYKPNTMNPLGLVYNVI